MKDLLPQRVRLGAFEVDLRAGEVRNGEHAILLPEQPFQVLRMLIERAGEIVTREEIQKKLWPNDTVVEFDHSINSAVNKLRQVLGDAAAEPRYIETIVRRGYRLLLLPEAVSDALAIGPNDGDVGVLRAPAASSPPPSPLKGATLIGRKVSHYRVANVLGVGGMGLVYEAEDLKLGRAVALKFLPEDLARDGAALQRFEREARAASSLDHPNICTIYEVEEHEGEPFIVMQLLRGETLRDRLVALQAAQQRFSVSEVLDIAAQVCDGLVAAHAKGVIHRDIKPANIFLTTSGAVKILDFGLAKVLEVTSDIQVGFPHGAEKGHGFSRAAAASIDKCGIQLQPELNPAQPFGEGNNGTPEGVPLQTQQADGNPLTTAGLTMGTAGYMSPEQVRGEQMDERTDLFSFGLVLYEVATGQRAFGGDTAAMVKEAIQNHDPVSLRERNPALPPKLESIVNRALEKDRERRYQSALEMRTDLLSLAEENNQSKAGRSGEHSRWKWVTAGVLVCILTLVAGLLYWRSHMGPKLTAQDTIVIADFENKTGDEVFNDTLKQGLAVQLGQSPYFNILSDRKVRDTLKLMKRPASEPLTESVGREVCVRSSSKAMLVGSIAKLNEGYAIGLKAVDCDMGGSLAEVQERAESKEAVLKALDRAALTMRTKLGESLTSIEKYGTPLSEATTPSLEALKSYSLGMKVGRTEGATASLPHYMRAVELDPNFATAFHGLSVAYINLNERERAAECIRKAYELRDRVSQRERFAIEGDYYAEVTGELERAAQTYELWQQNYPRDVKAVANLGNIYAYLGNMEKFLQQSRAAMTQAPSNTLYINLGAAYMNLNRLDEAEQAFKEAEQRGLSARQLLAYWYQLAFLKGDKAKMAQMLAAAMGKSGIEDMVLATQADTEGWYGRFENARKLTQRAVELATRNDAKETAANYQAATALREVAAGNRQQGRADAVAALRMSQSRDVKAIAAVALAQAGDTDRAEKLADELGQEFPLDTVAQRYWLPTIRAAVALERKDPGGAVELLNGVGPIELGVLHGGINVYLCPVYIRGNAYLQQGNGKAAAAEFQKFIDHYGLLTNFPWGALARLGLARAYALEAETDPSARDKARVAYESFLTLWKDADPDIPIYKQAKAEYSKLE